MLVLLTVSTVASQLPAVQHTDFAKQYRSGRGKETGSIPLTLREAQNSTPASGTYDVLTDFFQKLCSKALQDIRLPLGKNLVAHLPIDGDRERARRFIRGRPVKDTYCKFVQYDNVLKV